MTLRQPQEIYATHLSDAHAAYGYPLGTPGPDQELRDNERTNGLEVGDVGKLDPKTGSFQVLFNIRFDAQHPFHQAFGVPEGFTAVDMQGAEVIEDPQIAESKFTWTTPNVITSHPEENCTTFDLRAPEGSVLHVPKGGVICYSLEDTTRFVRYALRHAHHWYSYARQRRNWTLQDDELYLITKLYKAKLWAIATYDGLLRAEGFQATFRTIEHTWETDIPLHTHTSLPGDQPTADQALFIQGLNIAVQKFPGGRCTTVFKDNPGPGRIPNRARFSRVSFSLGLKLLGFSLFYKLMHQIVRVCMNLHATFSLLCGKLQNDEV